MKIIPMRADARNPTPFEVWLEDGVLRIVFCKNTRINLLITKEAIILFAILLEEHEAIGVCIECEAYVTFDDVVEQFLMRWRGYTYRNIGFVADDQRQQDFAERLSKSCRKNFCLRTFRAVENCYAWLNRFPATSMSVIAR